ncbi:putative cyclophilin [Neospora caninum Liverpool]|uniref:peptidylprolyl isomerase n=1 Tax=Neospora caninum (strain Liverpool) TaxID=572307 RepID=F0VA05_NEOCL|nr:putative cyclophilin [Neospora caninum Liverpool]CBZ50494.1 putative cyclophilin [Neospora caninum Liverpool]CEL65104.1 TPA: cyclophilin, putative [Neospora caninum Liverpool]|eukprot:XP_003880527.1 putative cyclophilin [Neospora caninum Liverpool]
MPTSDSQRERASGRDRDRRHGQEADRRRSGDTERYSGEERAEEERAGEERDGDRVSRGHHRARKPSISGDSDGEKKKLTRQRRHADTSGSDEEDGCRHGENKRGGKETDDEDKRRNDGAGKKREEEAKPVRAGGGEGAPSSAHPEDDESSDDDSFGPAPAAKGPAGGAHGLVKRRRLVPHEELYLKNLPHGERYFRSFMHRDEVSHVVVSPLHRFIITGSIDGHVKFWIREGEDIEFVKHFRAHVGALHCLCVSAADGGAVVGSVGSDQTFRLFEVVTFDMLCLLKLAFMPLACEFVHGKEEPSPVVAISAKETPEIFLYKPTLGTESVASFSLHMAPVHLLRFNPVLDVCVSSDKDGGLEVWCTDSCQRATRENRQGKIRYFLKSETDQFELAKLRTYALALAVTPDGHLLAVLSADSTLRIFRFATGKISKVYLETIDMYQTAQNDPQRRALHVDALDFEHRLAAEKELSKSRAREWQTMGFDESSNFLVYPCMLGIKVVNIKDNKLCRLIGKPEHSLRFLAIGVYQAKAQKRKPTTTVILGKNAKGQDAKDENRMDSVIVASAFKKNRVYFFTADTQKEGIVDLRDVFNEKPSKEEQEALAPSASSAIAPSLRSGRTATIFTTMGDIFIRLFPQECPKTVENFCTHARNGYYDHCIFHRVIKGFMIQTGDPNGDGTGGESIWGGDFEDEFHRSLKHDRPFTVSMANAGPNTNGSQFFITTVPCSWLDNKHTVFGRVVQGMDVVTKIENVATNIEDKPKQDVKLLTIKVTS